MAAFETRTFDPNGPCPWFKTPPEPQPGQSSSSAESGGAFTAPTAIVTRHVNGALDRRSDFSAISCADWNAANDTDRAWLVARVAEFVGGVVVDEKEAVGYGDTLPTARANDLFNSTCQNEYAQGFLLYKLYSYAAVLTP